MQEGDRDEIEPPFGHRRIFFDTFFASVSLSFFAAVLEAFWWCRDLLFSVFTAEIQCFLRFHEVRRGLLFLMNLHFARHI